MRDKMYMENWGKSYEVESRREKYYNNNLAIWLDCLDEEFGCWMPYGSLTVNLDKELPPDMAYLDTNKIPMAEEFVTKYKKRCNPF